VPDLRTAVHVWIAALEEPVDAAALADVLTPEEMERARRFHDPRLGLRQARGRAALRVVLGAELGCEPRAVGLGAGPHGKPRLAGGAAAVEFNLSHAGPVAAIAMTRAGPVGVDVERLAAVRDAGALARRFFDAAEAAAIAGLPAPLAEAAFLRCWTSKEAVLKALGVGLTRPLRDVPVEPDPRRAARLLRAPGPLAPDRWTLHELGLPDARALVSVAVAAPGVALAGVHRLRLAERLSPPGPPRSSS